MDEIARQVESWIAWSRASVAFPDGIPKITSRDLDFPWAREAAETAHSFAEKREELLESFASHLVADLTDVGARFTALHVYATFAGIGDGEYYFDLADCFEEELGLDEVEVEMGMSEDSGDYRKLVEQCERNASNLTNAFWKDLGTLVGMLKCEDVPPHRDYISWEILNSYAVQGWDRALELYNGAESLGVHKPSTAWLLRAQFRYLRLFASELEMELDSLDWEPLIYDEERPGFSLLLLLSGLQAARPARPLEQTDALWLRHAVTDFENAFAAGPEPPAHYRALLARCLTLTGRARDAAEHYEMLLNCDIIAGTPALKRLAYEAAASAYQESGEHGKAADVLDAWAKDFPSQKGIYLHLAELLAKTAEFDAIPHYLREEAARDPELDRDWKVSTLLALGEIRDTSKQLLQELKGTEDFGAFKSLLRDYWPPFRDFTEKAKEEWVHGVLLTHFCPGHGLPGYWLRQAGLAFAKALEVELLATVFSKFRDQANGDGGLGALAREACDRRDPELEIFAEFLIGGSDLALGQMAYILEHSRNSTKPLYREFGAWIQSNFPNLAAKSRALGTVREFRNPASHGRSPTVDPAVIPGLCREVIEAVHLGAGPDAAPPKSLR
jgi:tetratricopeptide (TPR) repeat protein